MNAEQVDRAAVVREGFTLIRGNAPGLATLPASTSPARSRFVELAGRLEARSPRAAAIIEGLVIDILHDIETRAE